MNILDKTIVEIHEALLNKEVKVSDLVKEAIKRAKENKDNAFEMILEEDALKEAYELDKEEVPVDNLLFGIPYVSKDNISTKGYETTGGSNILKGYLPLYDATVIKLLKDKKAVLIGKTTLDELAMGGTGTSGHLGIQYNPYDDTNSHLVGGSSSGSAVATSAGIVPFSLGSDTGDSVRKPASNVGLVGYKPTYGLISRFGLFPFSVSMDHIAYFSRSVEDCGIIFDCLNQYDENDYTSSLKEREKVTPLNKDKKYKIAVVKEIINSIDDKKINEEFNKLIDKLKAEGHTIDYVSIDEKILRAVFPAYIIISSSEATSNNANLDGIKFGNRKDGKTYEEVMFNTRNEGFGELIKRRFVLGSYALMSENQNEVFLKAKRVRRIIVKKINELFENYDFFIAPSSPSVAPKIGGASDKLDNSYLIADNYLGIGNFGGYPSITLPLGFKENLPFGVSLTGGIFKDKDVLNMSLSIEKATGLKNLSINTKNELEAK